MSSHPILAHRRELFFDACTAHGYARPTIIRETRPRERQEDLHTLWQNYLAGREPSRNIEAANPNAVFGWCPPELGHWQVLGSKHMLQEDGWSHAEDWDWGLRSDDRRIRGYLHPLASEYGFAFPVAGENWHAEYWVSGRLLPGPMPHTPAPPIKEEDDDMTEDDMRKLAGFIAEAMDARPRGVYSYNEGKDLETNARQLEEWSEMELQQIRRNG